MVTEPVRRWPAQEFRRGDAMALPIPDATLAGYRADKVFHELVDPAGAAAEAHRVLTSGGRIVLLGQDWDTIAIDSDRPCLTRSIVDARADTIASPRAARGYRNLLLDTGFTEVEVEVRTAILTGKAILPMLAGVAHAAGAAGVAEADDWMDEQTQRAEADRLFVAMPLFVAAATRP
jgi:SAM-dependent methyltransferase